MSSLRSSTEQQQRTGIRLGKDGLKGGGTRDDLIPVYCNILDTTSSCRAFEVNCRNSPRRFSGVAIEPAVNWLALLHLVRDPAGNHHDSAVEWAPDLVQSTSGLLLKFLLAELAVFVHQ